MCFINNEDVNISKFMTTVITIDIIDIINIVKMHEFSFALYRFAFIPYWHHWHSHLHNPSCAQILQAILSQFTSQFIIGGVKPLNRNNREQ